jgi:hypothetical protein
MSKHIYIEQTNDGRFGIKPGKAAPPVMTTRTQKEAIQYSKMMFPDSRPDVERVKHTNRGHPDQWRKA